jgi:hypothetical protein
MAKREEGSYWVRYWVQGTSAEDKILIPRIDGYVDCDQTGDDLIIDHPIEKGLDGVVSKLSIAGKIENTVLTYHRNASKEFANFPGNSAMVAISPNLQSAAFDAVTFDQNPPPSGVKLIRVGHSQHRPGKRSIQWSADSTFLLNSMITREGYGNQKFHQEAVQVIKAQSGENVIGNLPQGVWFEKGVILAGGKKLLIFARSSSKDVGQDPGSVYTCEVAPIVSCHPILSSVDDVSFSDDGRFASVKELYKDSKHRVDGDADVLPSGYVAEIRNADGALLVSQRFIRKDNELAFSLFLAPTSKEVILIGGGKRVIVSLDTRVH